jgi:hypothetical protein
MVDLRVAASEPTTEGRSCRVVVDHECPAAGPQHPIQLDEAGLAAGPEEVRPACVRHVDRRVRDGERCCRPVENGDVAEPTGATASDGREVGVRLDPDHRVSGLGEQREVEAGAAADVEDVTTGPWAE